MTSLIRLETATDTCKTCGGHGAQYARYPGGVMDGPYHQLCLPEKKPTPNDRPAVWSLVIDDMQKRDGMGRKKYGTPLQPFNGRDVLRDAYEEALDLAVYLRQAIYERDEIAKKEAKQ